MPIKAELADRVAVDADEVFPKLMYHTGIDGIIIVTGRNKTYANVYVGTVLKYLNGHPHGVREDGFHYDRWMVSAMSDFHGTITLENA